MSNEKGLERIRKAGHGGMGEVYEAWDPVIARRLALKELRSDRLEFRDAFIAEAQVAGRLEHPHIVPVHGLGFNSGNPYFTMTWVEGETLQERLVREFGTYARLVEHLEVLDRVCDAVEFAHSRGVVHRDIKPENILIGNHGRVYLTDWGIAKVFDAGLFGEEASQVRGVEGADGKRLGTLEYMAPEQVRGDNSGLGPTCDIWALGVLLYECVAGITPFRGDDSEATAAAILGGEFAPPSERVGQLRAPSELEAIIERALQWNPDERYSRVADFENDLKAFLRGTTSLPLRTYEKGDVIVLQGEMGREAYVLESGRCDVWAAEEGADPVKVGAVDAGQFFGEAALITDTLRSASVVAAESCLVRVVDREAVDRERGRMRPWLASFVTTLVERFRGTNEEVLRSRGRATPEAVAHQAVLWLAAYGERSDERLAGSWQRCSKDLMEHCQLGRGPLRALLERNASVAIDGGSDSITIEGWRALLDE